MKVYDEEPKEFSSDHHSLIHSVTLLPHKILSNYFMSELPQLVLHDLGHDENFGFKRAVYLIDNPDFDHLVGVAGFCKDECKHHKEDIWHEPHSFKTDMEPAHFHKEMKQFLRSSLKRRDIDIHKSGDIKELGTAMGLNDPKFLTWKMKHGNHGLLIFEKQKNLCPWRDKMLKHSSALLSLCGISGI
jgi:hypothetical protein